MKIAVVRRREDPHSLASYRESLVRELPALGVTCEWVDEHETSPLPPSCDLLWDPGLGMRRVPPLLLRSERPVVASVHGLRAFSLPLRDCARGCLDRARILRTRYHVARDWERLRERVHAVITVSRYGSEEAVRALRLDPGRVHAIPHGVDHVTFRPHGATAVDDEPYFLAVAQYQPKKNVERVLAAHAMLRPPRPRLVAIVPGLPARRRLNEDVVRIDRALDAVELARWYRGALALVFPSLHETFGMPIVEAMACGCPVVTSRTTACAETAGDAALLVEPRSVASIAHALALLISEPPLTADLRRRGLARAAHFSWRRSASEHARAFAAALEQAASSSRPTALSRPALGSPAPDAVEPRVAPARAATPSPRPDPAREAVP